MKMLIDVNSNAQYVVLRRKDHGDTDRAPARGAQGRTGGSQPIGEQGGQRQRNSYRPTNITVSMQKTTSVNGVTIRLTDERWTHIVQEHGEISGMMGVVLQTVNEPEVIFAGNSGELLAVRKIETEKFLVVPYREQGEDGFIITAFMTKRLISLQRRSKLWPK